MTKSTWALVALALLGGFYVLFQIATRTPEPPSHQVFIGGAVLTMNTEQPIAEAVSVRGDRIEAVGTTDEIMALVSEQTEVNDLMGRTLVPGFIDAHGHFPGSGLYSLVANLSSPPVGSVVDMDMLVERLKEQAARTEEGDWIIGLSYDDTAIAEVRHPTRSDLDRVSETQPVVALHSSLHFASVNSAALERLGINRATPDPDGGVIVRDEQGEPTGVLEENAMMSLMGEVLSFGAFDGFLMAKAAVKDYAQHGVTTANMGAGSREQMEGMRLMSKWGVVPQRLTVMPLQTDFDQEIKAGTFDEVKWDADRFDTVGFKIVADGSIQGYTGYLSHPYHVPFKGDASYRGYARVAREALFEQVREIFKHGYHVAIHTNGDESIQDALDAVEAALSEFPREDHRTILIHAQMARKDQIKRMASLGVTPSFFTAHVYFWGDRHRDIFMGPDRAENISPSQWAIENGVRFTTHLDTPVVPMRPLRAVSAMVNRKTSSGEVLGDYQKTDVMTALRATTIDAAWQVRREADLGSIEVGKLADLVVLSGNPLDNAELVHDLKVERTIIGGVTIYER
jgi:predicted amidohydrolase YtcJ